jgi:hypothetical protein
LPALLGPERSRLIDMACVSGIAIEVPAARPKRSHGDDG